MPWRWKTRSESPGLTAAKKEHALSVRLYNQAMVLIREIEKLREENHFADSLRAIVEDEK